MLALRIVEILFPLFFIVSLGTWYARRYDPDMTVTNTLNLHIFSPALIFSSLVNQNAGLASFQPLILGTLVVVFGTGAFGWTLSRLSSFNPKTLALPMMFRNIGNLGLPLYALSFGTVAMPAAVMVLVVQNFCHFTLGVYLLGSRVNPLKNLISPIILVTPLALIINGLQIPLHEALIRPINMMGQVSIPVMLFSLGTQLAKTDFSDWKIALAGAIATPLCGLLVVFAILPFLDLSPLHTGILILFGTLPPAVVNFLLAQHYEQEPKKVASIVVLSHLFAAFISLPIILAYVLPRFG